MTDINPDTGRPYAIDEQIRSRQDFTDTAGDISEAGKAATDILTPGPNDLIKKLPKILNPGLDRGESVKRPGCP